MSFCLSYKYRKKVLISEVSSTFKDVCLKIEKRYEIHFLEIGLDDDYVYFLEVSILCYWFRFRKNKTLDGRL
ncbi:transposase [Maribacter antarcticus]|uniref:transposase n=1 Tax=Maribacter antarcticus TaxID=505250 RepID=UPI000A0013AF